jgi:protein SCO1/2
VTRILFAFALLLLAVPALATTTAPPPKALDEVSFEQRLGARLPLDAELVGEDGRPVRLSRLVAFRPAILVLGYYRCKMLCEVVFDELASTLERVPYDPGRDYDVIVVSIDPSDDATRATERRRALEQSHGRMAGWHFLTGPSETTRRIADAVGFHYAYDAETDQYAHPAGIVVLTPTGEAARYLFGMRFQPRDVRLALTEAGRGTIGSPVDQALLRCYHYDPVTGQYGLAIMGSIRGAALATLLGLALFIALAARRRRRREGATR